MKKIIFALAVLALTVSCKSKAVLADKSPAVLGDSLSAASVIERHYQNPNDYKTLFITASARYEDDKQSQNVSADIRIKKDEKILVSVKFLGITMAKALLTPTQVKYYAKTESEYFEGDYSMLERWLGTDLDFQKVQNLLTGEAVDDLNNGDYNLSVDGAQYVLQQLFGKTQKGFWLDNGRLLLRKQRIAQPDMDRSIEVRYPDHVKHGSVILPDAIQISAQQPKGKASINVNYKSVAVNQEISFPYSVPDGYERIFID
jgi:hypothetical protein